MKETVGAFLRIPTGSTETPSDEATPIPPRALMQGARTSQLLAVWHRMQGVADRTEKGRGKDRDGRP